MRQTTKVAKVLHCIQTVNPAGGGVIEAVRQLAVAEAGLGHSVEVVSLDDPKSRWVQECTLTVHALGPGLGGYGYCAKFSRWMRVRHCDYHAIVVHGLWQYISLGTWRALRGTGKSYFVFPHGMLDPWFKRTYPLKHLKKWLYWPWAEYRVLRDANAVLFTCEQERVLARESFWLYQCQEQVVGLGIAAPGGDAGAQAEKFRTSYPQLSGKRCLLFLGRVHVKKGPDLLFLAFAAALKRLSSELTKDVQLVIAGPNDHAYGLEMAALVNGLGLQNRVTWTGMITGDIKWGAFHSANAFILPSHQENFGISVTEALACGLPVLISNQVNIWREIVADGAGYVETDDLEGTISLLEQWLQTPADKWLAMRQQAQKCYQARFNIEQAASLLVRAMESFGKKERATE